ncbi:MAG: hypothetical protein AAGI30_00725 [Planctomycetota bacterium]
MPHPATRAILLLTALALGGCAVIDDTDSTPIVGQLESGIVAIGGETTGWQIVQPGLVTGRTIEADVSGVLTEAEHLDRRFVQAFGEIETRTSPERGERRVLVVTELREAP